ncbi:MAG: tryptophan synthase subunit alpha [Leptospiraceae bacterium]|nr:tryptophan synthase subunit alpha [Leptospiraceae bacterium]
MNLQEYIQHRQKSLGRPLYMPYITAGDPDLKSTVSYALALIDGGADVLELGIPFSDPTADGPVIQEAMVRAMANADFNIDHVLDAAAQIHEQRPEVPIVLLGYLNPVLSHFFSDLDPEAEKRMDPINPNSGCQKSIHRFLTRASECGVQGMVIPDLPFDAPEAELFRSHSSGISLVSMIAPNTSAARQKQICKKAGGFIYYVSALGTTGERKELSPEIANRVKTIKEDSGVPLFVGFGVSQPEQARALAPYSDGVIVGSLNQRLIDEEPATAAQRLKSTTAAFVAALASAATA